MDGSTDSGNTEQELVLVIFCKQDEARREIKSHTHYLAVVSPEKTSSDGLVDCLEKHWSELAVISRKVKMKC